MNYLVEKKVSPQFYDLYIKDRAEPLDVLAQILATHRFENEQASNQFKKWTNIVRTLYKKFSFTIMDSPVNTSMEHVVEVFQRKQKFGYLLQKIDAVVMGQ